MRHVRLGLLGFSLLTAHGQQPAPSANNLADQAKAGFPLPTDLTVQANVTAQAVLLPPKVVERIFGKEIAHSYAVVEVNVANKSREASFIMHGLFLDYSQWALSGYMRAQAEAQNQQPAAADHPERYQASTSPDQVASVEARLARGQLLDAQQWTARNWTVRLLTVAGEIASAYSFSLKEKNLLKGISAFGGVVVPGVSAVWPDETVAQLNRISDFGYQTNKVFTREDGEVLVGFFPIDRFLTPGLRKLFLRSPATFFQPLSMLVDRQSLQAFRKVVPDLVCKENLPSLRKALPTFIVSQQRTPPGPGQNPTQAAGGGQNPTPSAAAEQTAALNALAGCPAAGQPPSKELTAAEILGLLQRSSLNTIHVVVDGIMSVDISAVPAKIESVTFDSETDPATWGQAHSIKGVIRGSFLGDGEVRIAEADTLGIKNVAVSADGSNDQQLHFSMELTKPVAAGTTLTFRIAKTDKQGRTVESSPFTYPVAAKAGATPDLASLTPTSAAPGDTVNVKGKEFYDSVSAPIAVVVGTQTVPRKDITLVSPTELNFVVPQLPAGMADVSVKTNAGESKKLPLTITAPKVASAQPAAGSQPAGGQTAAAKPAADDPNAPLVLRVKDAYGRPGQRNVGFTVMGDRLDRIRDIRGPEGDPLNIRGFVPSADGNYLDVGVSVPASTKPGTYKIDLIGPDGKTVVKQVEYQVK